MSAVVLDSPKYVVMPDITDHDYCDQCHARAVAVVLVGELPLYFCGHHFRNHLPYFNKSPYRFFSALDIEEDILFKKRKTEA